MALWTGVVAPGEALTFVPSGAGKEKLRITWACLAPGTVRGASSTLLLRISDAEDPHAVAVLGEGGSASVKLNLVLDKLTRFSVDGTATIHLTGQKKSEGNSNGDGVGRTLDSLVAADTLFLMDKAEDIADEMTKFHARTYPIWNLCFELMRKLVSCSGARELVHTPNDLDKYPYYYDIINDPIDLNTIWGNLQTSHYSDVFEFRDDMLRCFDNCRRYSTAESSMRRRGERVAVYFDRLWKKYAIEDAWKADMARYQAAKDEVEGDIRTHCLRAAFCRRGGDPQAASGGRKRRVTWAGDSGVRIRLRTGEAGTSAAPGSSTLATAS